MRAVVRSNVGVVSALLSVVALGVVFGGVFRVIPAGPLPYNSTVLMLIPHVNAIISLLAIGTILLGIRNIRGGQVRRHRGFMSLSTALFGSFLVLYLYKIIIEGPTVFSGPAVLKQFVYLPLLAIHVILAVIAVPLVIYVLLLAATHSVAELPSTPHPRFGRVAASLWLVSFALGILVYLLLYIVF